MTTWYVDTIEEIMKRDTLTTKEIIKEYRNLHYDLVNSYCQMRESRPYEEFPRVRGLIDKVQSLLDLWRELEERLSWMRKGNKRK
jgi:hypothetical protein